MADSTLPPKRICVYCQKEIRPEDFVPRGGKRKKGYLQPYCRLCARVKGLELYAKYRFVYANRGAKQSGRPMVLKKSEYEKLTSLPCHYCNLPISDWGIGLDRLDNDKGYELGNVVPCCPVCNKVRNNIFTPDEMRRVIGPAIRKIADERMSTGHTLTTRRGIGRKG